MPWVDVPGPGTAKAGGMQTTHDIEPVVHVRGLRKSYGGRMVVHDLDLDVAAGEVVGLIGANGAGKTTTVEILQGLRRADAGEVSVLGLDPVRDSETAAPADRQPAPELRAAGPDAGARGRAAVRRTEGHQRRGAARAVRPRPPAPLPVRGDERRRAAAALPGARPPQPAAAGHPRRAHPGTRPERPSGGLVGRLPAARGRDHGPAGHPRARRGRGAVRPGGRDARRPGPRRRHAGRARGPARRPGHHRLRAPARHPRRPRGRRCTASRVSARSAGAATS